MLDGPPLDTGEAATRLLAEAVEMAKAVIAAKDWPGGRFTGAEVDLMVAHEVRQISEAARRATEILREALGVIRIGVLGA